MGRQITRREIIKVGVGLAGLLALDRGLRLVEENELKKLNRMNNQASFCYWLAAQTVEPKGVMSDLKKEQLMNKEVLKCLNSGVGKEFTD